MADIKEYLRPEGLLLFSVPNDIGFFTRRIKTFLKGVPYSTVDDPYTEQHIRFFYTNSIKIFFETHDINLLEHSGINMSLPLGIRERVERLPFHKKLAAIYPNWFATNYVGICQKK